MQRSPITSRAHKPPHAHSASHHECGIAPLQPTKRSVNGLTAQKFSSHTLDNPRPNFPRVTSRHPRIHARPCTSRHMHTPLRWHITSGAHTHHACITHAWHMHTPTPTHSHHPRAFWCDFYSVGVTFLSEKKVAKKLDKRISIVVCLQSHRNKPRHQNLNVMYTTQQHIAAIFDSIQSIGLDMVRSTTEWDQLTTDEQMLVEQEAQSH